MNASELSRTCEAGSNSLWSGEDGRKSGREEELLLLGAVCGAGTRTWWWQSGQRKRSVCHQHLPALSYKYRECGVAPGRQAAGSLGDHPALSRGQQRAGPAAAVMISRSFGQSEAVDARDRLPRALRAGIRPGIGGWQAVARCSPCLADPCLWITDATRMQVALPPCSRSRVRSFSFDRCRVAAVAARIVAALAVSLS